MASSVYVSGACMLDGVNYPRVTEILQAYTSYHTVPQHILGKAAARGTRVHAICAGIANGAWISSETIGEEYIGYVRSFEKWFDENVKEVLIVEKRYIDKKFEYTGQIDLLILSKKGRRCLVDLKTSSKKQKTYEIQMAAYCGMLDTHGITVNTSMIVYLQKDGEEAKVVESHCWDKELYVFKCALNCWRYFNGREIKSLPENTCDYEGPEIHSKGFSES